MAKTQVAGKENNKVGRPPIEKEKPMTPAERAERYRKNRTKLKAEMQIKKNKDRKKEKYA